MSQIRKMFYKLETKNNLSTIYLKIYSKKNYINLKRLTFEII